MAVVSELEAMKAANTELESRVASLTPSVKSIGGDGVFADDGFDDDDEEFFGFPDDSDYDTDSDLR
jgi:hypothetical protein